MLRHLIFFEWKFYYRKISFYVMLVAFFGLGIFTGTSAGIAFPNIKYNSPYAINFILGLFSLAGLFPIVITASQSLIREKENRFEQLLYASLITVKDYFISRFSVVFGVAILTFVLFLSGYISGHQMQMDNSDKWGDFHWSYYLNSFFVIVVPNILLCSAIVASTAWFSKNKMLIYLSGLGIYILYMVTAIFSNSPLIAGASPASESAMGLAAKIDPFGMAAFYDQTHHWSALQRNTTVLQLSGNLLINRIGVVLLALFLLGLAYRFFRFKTDSKRKKKAINPIQTYSSSSIYMSIKTQSDTKHYFLATVGTFVKIDLKASIKSIPFLLLILITLFIVGMEMYGAIEGGIRLPENYVTSTLMINTILETLPFILLIAMLFYGSELVWRNKNVRFYDIENSTPFSPTALYLSKFISLVMIVSILIASSSILGIAIQLLYDYYTIDWHNYLLLFYFVGLPASLCGLLIIALQYIIKNKYIALCVAGVFLILATTSLGNAMGLSHPLLRFNSFLPDILSEMNGFGYFPKAFFFKIMYNLSFVLLLSVAAVASLKKSILKISRVQIICLLISLSMMVMTGYYLNSKNDQLSDEAQLNWCQEYETNYKPFKNKPQLSITDVKVSIDLYPEKNSYHVKGSYILVNKNTIPISEIIVNSSEIVRMNKLTSSELILVKKDSKFGHSVFKPKKPIKPNDSILLQFDFEYTIEPLQGHESFNAIVENGAFMRISRYFPGLGYVSDNEIQDKEERKRRKMPPLDVLTKVDAPMPDPYNYNFINLDALVSTSIDQTAVAVGELQKKFSKNNRNYFHYVAKDIPFRFAVSSARYAVFKSNYNNIKIEILYDSKHHQNIKHLNERIQKSLIYCETNFGNYPYKTLRFAEISSFTNGFAATAYPACIFINEKFLHLNLKADKQQDIINELAGHELSHQWWGNAQLSPDYRQGSGILTETLAQYTELMLYKNQHGKSKMEEMVNLHQNLYDSEKAFSGEEALYVSNPDNANVLYNKGLIKMYELYRLIGERKINLALANLLKKHKFPLQPVTALDLIDELKAVSEINKHKQIEDLFKK